MMMMRSAPVLFFGLLELSSIVEGNRCPWVELNGEHRSFPCRDQEYCCNFGCCVSPAFHFYQLWHYWLLVIFMFLLCSGGGWWYRYWLQSRYRNRSLSTLPHHVHAARSNVSTLSTQPRVARVSYNPSRDTVILHHMWKGPRAAVHRNSPPPSYSSAQNNVHIAEMSSTLDSSQQTSVDISGNMPTTNSIFPFPNHISHDPGTNTQNECPYYQLYGPPPSYESVVADQSQKLSLFASHENNTDDNVAGTSVAQNVTTPGTINSSTRSLQNRHINPTIIVNSTGCSIEGSTAIPSTSSGESPLYDPEQTCAHNVHTKITFVSGIKSSNQYPLPNICIEQTEARNSSDSVLLSERQEQKQPDNDIDPT